MIKYKIEGNNADEFRKMIMGVEVEKQEKQVKDNGKCPVCGGTEFDMNTISATHFGGNRDYTYQGKICLACSYIKPTKY